MTKNDLLVVLKDVVVAAGDKSDPTHTPESAELRARVEASLTVDAPLAQLGWDSLRMTWVLVRLEERLNIDTSSLSLFDLFTVGDLLEELEALTNQTAAANV
jgi:acyl carrier protein